MLFNAVTKAQRAQQEAVAAGLKGVVKAAKGAFLTQLQSSAQPGTVVMGLCFLLCLGFKVLFVSNSACASMAVTTDFKLPVSLPSPEQCLCPSQPPVP